MVLPQGDRGEREDAGDRGEREDAGDNRGVLSELSLTLLTQLKLLLNMARRRQKFLRIDTKIL